MEEGGNYQLAGRGWREEPEPGTGQPHNTRAC